MADPWAPFHQSVDRLIAALGRLPGDIARAMGQGEGGPGSAPNRFDRIAEALERIVERLDKGSPGRVRGPRRARGWKARLLRNFYTPQELKAGRRRWRMAGRYGRRAWSGVRSGWARAKGAWGSFQNTFAGRGWKIPWPSWGRGGGPSPPDETATTSPEGQTWTPGTAPPRRGRYKGKWRYTPPKPPEPDRAKARARFVGLPGPKSGAGKRQRKRPPGGPKYPGWSSPNRVPVYGRDRAGNRMFGFAASRRGKFPVGPVPSYGPDQEVIFGPPPPGTKGIGPLGLPGPAGAGGGGTAVAGGPNFAEVMDELKDVLREILQEIKRLQREEGGQPDDGGGGGAKDDLVRKAMGNVLGKGAGDGPNGKHYDYAREVGNEALLQILMKLAG